MEGAAGQQQKDQEQQQQSCGRQVAAQQHAPQQRPQEQGGGSPAEQPAAPQAGMAAAAPAGAAPPAGQAAGEAALQRDEVAMDIKCSADLEAEVALMLSGMNQSVMEGPAPTESAGAARCCCCGLPAAAHLRAVVVAVCVCQIANPLNIMYSMARQHCCLFAAAPQSLATLPPASRHQSTRSCQPVHSNPSCLVSAPSGSGAASGDAQQAAGPDNVPVLPDWVRNRGEHTEPLITSGVWDEMVQGACVGGWLGTCSWHNLRHARQGITAAGMQACTGRAAGLFTTGPRPGSRHAPPVALAAPFERPTPHRCSAHHLVSPLAAPFVRPTPLLFCHICARRQPKGSAYGVPHCGLRRRPVHTRARTCWSLLLPAAAACHACSPAGWLRARKHKGWWLTGTRYARLSRLHAGQSPACCLPSSLLPCYACRSTLLYKIPTH